MTAVVEEGFFSRPATVGETASGEMIYYVLDEPDEVVAHLAAVTASPASYRSMPRQSSGIKRLSPSIYEVSVSYGLPQNQVKNSDPETSEFNTVLAFNMTGGTSHITTALDTTSYAPALVTPVDVKKTIGIDLKTGQVRGLDMFAPILDYSLTTRFANSVVTQTYIDTLYSMTPCVNNATFYGRPAGSVLFKGARGSKRGQEQWELGFEFAYSKNVTGKTIGTITGIEKTGWQYLETMYVDGSATLGGKKIQVPGQVNVHTVFESMDFAALKIGTGA